MKSQLIIRRNKKKATILTSKRTVEAAIQRADTLGQVWMEGNPNDPRIDELERIVDHLSSVLKQGPQQMRQDGASSIEDYFDDAKLPEQANTIKREVNMIAKWHDAERPPAAPRTPEQRGVGYVPDTAVSKGGIHASDKKAVTEARHCPECKYPGNTVEPETGKCRHCEKKVMEPFDKKATGAGAFVTDRDEKGEPKAPEKVGVPRLAVKKKKEAVPEPAAPVVPPAPTPDMGGKVNPIDYIPTETLIKVIGDLPKEEDFAQNKGKQDALVELTNILKSRPIEPPEQPEAAKAPAAPAPMVPVAASAKAGHVRPMKQIVPSGTPTGVPAETFVKDIPQSKGEAELNKKYADLGDHAMGSNGSIGDAGSGAGPSNGGNTNGGNPQPEQAPTSIDLGGLNVASSEKTADDYRLHDFKVQDDGVVPTGKLPSMEEQEDRMHPDEGTFEKESVSPPGWSGTTEAMKEHSDIDNPWALSWYMKNKGDKPHYKESGDEPDSVPRRMAALKIWKERQASMNKELASKYASGAAGGGWSFDIGEKGKITEDGGRLPEVAEAHSQLDESGARLERPVTTAPIKLAADMTTGKAVKQSESLGNDLKKIYLDAKALTQINDTRAVREAVEAIFRAANMFDEATKVLNKQQQQEESEAAAAEIKAKNKKSSFRGLELAAAAE